MTRTIEDVKANIKANGTPEPTREPVIVTLSTVKPEKVTCHWYPYLVRSRVNLAIGDAGIGKSFLTHVLIAANSTGRALPGEDGFGTDQGVRPPGSSILLTAEDGLPEIVAPRLIDMGADLTKVHAITGVSVTTSNGKQHEVSLTLADLGPLEDAIVRIRDVTLIVIDPLQSYVGATVDMPRANEMRPLLDGLGRLAEKYNLTILAITHMNRNSNASTTYRVSSSQELYNYARSVLVVAPDPSNKSRRIIAHQKHNGTPEGVSLAYEIRADGRFYWDGTSDLNAEQLLAPPQNEEERGALDEAVSWLESELSSGPVQVTAIQQAAKSAGLSWATIRRAKDQLSITSARASSGNAGAGRWEWTLPGAPTSNGLSTLRALPTMPMDTALSQDAQAQTLSTLPDARPGRQDAHVSQGAQANLALENEAHEVVKPQINGARLSDRADTWRRTLEGASRDDLDALRTDNLTEHTPEMWEATFKVEPLPVTVASVLIREDASSGTYRPGSHWQYLNAARAATKGTTHA